MQTSQSLTAKGQGLMHEESGFALVMVMYWQVCLYFMNLVLEDYENYTFWHTPDMMDRRNMYPHRFPPIREPHPSSLSPQWHSRRVQ